MKSLYGGGGIDRVVLFSTSVYESEGIYCKYLEMDLPYDIIRRYQPRDVPFELDQNPNMLLVVPYSSDFITLCDEISPGWSYPESIMRKYFERVRSATETVKGILDFLDGNPYFSGNECYFCGEPHIHRPDCSYLQNQLAEKIFSRMTP